MKTSDRLNHTFAPVYDKDSRILILGTFPSVKSRENHFYYGHPRNRFWSVISRIVGESLPETIEEKKKILLSGHIALWDVIASCTISGSSDSSIRDVIPNDIAALLAKSNIQYIFANGARAYELYMRYVHEETGRGIEKLPSTSPANAAYSEDRLYAIWKEKLDAHFKKI